MDDVRKQAFAEYGPSIRNALKSANQDLADGLFSNAARYFERAAGYCDDAANKCDRLWIENARKAEVA